MAKNKKTPARARAVNEKYLLSAAMTCAYCGRTVTGICGTSKTGGKKHYYYRCSAQNHKVKCELKTNRKQELEDFVVNKTLELLTPERIDDISRRIVALCEKERADNSALTALESRVKKSKTEARNLLDAIKAGKAVDTLLAELGRVEEQIKDMEREIIKEGLKYPQMTVDKVKFFMERFTKGDVKDLFFREKLIDTFIINIEVHNDKITILYTVQDGYSVEYPICVHSDLADQVGSKTNIVCFPFGFAFVTFFDSPLMAV